MVKKLRCQRCFAPLKNEKDPCEFCGLVPNREEEKQNLNGWEGSDMRIKREKNIGYLAPKYYAAKTYSYYGNIEAVNIVLIKFAMLVRVVEEPDWYVKGAALYFSYEDEQYVIEPGCLDTTAGRFDRISKELEDELYEVGAYDMFYAGMMD